MRHFIKGENLGLMICRQIVSNEWIHALCTNAIIDDSCVSNKTRERGYILPLWVYSDALTHVEKRRPNLDPNILSKIQKTVPDITPESLFDYIYAVLHSPAYRTRYAEFLKSDFPRIPYPSDPKIFHALAEKGAILRGLHLMDSPALDARITTYPVPGDHGVIKPRFTPDAAPAQAGAHREGGAMDSGLRRNDDKDVTGKVLINETQYFGGVPETAWNFYIGGYQPAQKWLKDRKGRCLSAEDIRHWQRVIVALAETGRVMQDIDGIDFLPQV